MALEVLRKLENADNFAYWFDTINKIIEELGSSDTQIKNLQDAISEAIERGQISEYLLNPSDRPIDSDEQIHPEWDWNEYTSNGVYWIPFNASYTRNPPLSRQVSGMCWVASGGSNGPVVQLAVTMEDVPTIAFRYGSLGNNGPVWPTENVEGQNGTTYTVYSWIEIPNRKYLDDNFLNKVVPELQEVNAPVKLLNENTALEVVGSANFDSDAFFNTQLIMKGSENSVIVRSDDSLIGNSPSTSCLTMEVAPNPEDPTNPYRPNTTFNLPLWSMSEGTRAENKTKYVEPFWIDKTTRTANINGTAEYANFIVPENMISKFKSYNISKDDLWKPVAAKAIKDFFDWTNETFLPLKGGTLTGIVHHQEDIFLDHIQNVPENRTAAIRSIVRPLQMQCQGSVHLVSNSKHSSLYLEKEDIDSAEYTTEHHETSFAFRRIELLEEICGEMDPNFKVMNSSPKESGCWDCMLSIGRLQVFANGHWEFTADDKLLSALGPWNSSRNHWDFTAPVQEEGEDAPKDDVLNDELRASIFYRVVNVNSDGSTGSTIAAKCQYNIRLRSGDPQHISGELAINDTHYQVAITDTDWIGLPVTIKSMLAPGSVLVDGCTVAAGSVLNGLVQNEEWIVNGMHVSYGTKDEDEYGDEIENPAYLAPGSIIKKDSFIATDSIINGYRWTNDISTNTDIAIVRVTDNDGNVIPTVLEKGSTLKSGSILALNSVINGFQYTMQKTVDGEEISENSMLEPGSRILLGSVISTASSLNGVPGKSGFLDVVCGRDRSEPGMLMPNSTILKNSILSPGSIVNGVEYAKPTIVESTIMVDENATIASGSRLAIGSLIAKGSWLNAKQWEIDMRAYGLDENVVLSKSDLAPILYIRSYENLQDKWNTWWSKSTFKDIYPSASEFDATLWKSWIQEQINNLNVEREFSEAIMQDLDKSLRNLNRDWNYPEREDVDALLTNGSWRLVKSSPSAPNHVFDTRCYVASHSRQIGIQRIFVQPFKTVYDNTGAASRGDSAHDPVMIFNNGNVVKPHFIAGVFEYFNFDVVVGYGSDYHVRYDTRLVPEQKNTSQKRVMEYLEVTAYSDADTANASQPIVLVEDVVSLDVEDMKGAPFIIGARTRTGITSTGQLGDPLYDLGCIEIDEDSIAWKIRKKNVSMQSEVKGTMSLVFERSTNDDLSSSDPVQQMAFRPSIDKTIDIGTGQKRFRNVYISSDPITTSDQNLKSEIEDFPDSLLKKWSKIKWTSFKFKDAIEEKGSNARIHAGVIAQDVQKALRGMDVFKWSFFCKDKWKNENEYEWIDVPAGQDEFGVWREAHTEKRILASSKAGQRYSIRYQEMQAIENAYLRREIDLLKKEIEILKQKIK